MQLVKNNDRWNGGTGIEISPWPLTQGKAAPPSPGTGASPGMEFDSLSRER